MLLILSSFVAPEIAIITTCMRELSAFDTLRPRQNGRRFADDIFKCIFLNENVWIPIKISLKFVPRGPISNIPALVQIMAWRRPGDKPLSEAMTINLLTHICVTRPQWVNAGYKQTWGISLCVGSDQCYPYLSPVQVKQQWIIWVNMSHESTRNWNIPIQTIYIFQSYIAWTIACGNFDPSMEK